MDWGLGQRDENLKMGKEIDFSKFCIFLPEVEEVLGMFE